MTAPDHFARAELNPFAGGGRPHMNFAHSLPRGRSKLVVSSWPRQLLDDIK
jgi:hypothetical protein